MYYKHLFPRASSVGLSSLWDQLWNTGARSHYMSEKAHDIHAHRAPHTKHVHPMATPLCASIACTATLANTV
jgi:hypothetical protein